MTGADDMEQARNDRAIAVQHEQCEAEHARLTDGIVEALRNLDDGCKVKSAGGRRLCRSAAHLVARARLEELL